MTAPRALVAFDRACKLILWPVLFLLTCFTPAPLHAEWVNVRLIAPLTYLGESVTADYSWSGYYGSFVQDGEYAVITGWGADTDDEGFVAKIETGFDYALVDHLTIQYAAENGGDVWLPFFPLPSQPATTRFLLPDWATSHSLALAQYDANGVPFNTPISISDSVWISDGSGSGSYVPRAYVPSDPTNTYWVVDLTTRTKSPQWTGDLRYVYWEPDYSQYPLVSVNMYLEGRELDHKFTVHSWAEGGPTMYSSVAATSATTSGSIYGYTWANLGNFNVPPGSACLTFPVGEGMSFYISRNADEVNTQAASGNGFVFVANSSTSLNWSLFGVFPNPPLRSLQSRNFRVNADRSGHAFTVLMSDGYNTHFGPWQYSGETISEWNGQYVYNPFQVLTFSASIDPTKNWWLRDDTTGEEFSVEQTDVFDGWSPQFDPPYPTITVHLPPWILVNSASISEIGSTDQIFPSASYPETTFYSGTDGMADFTIEGSVMEFPNPHPETTGIPFNFNSGFEFGLRTVYAGENDFRLNLPSLLTIDLYISSTRWDHELVVRHSEGTSYPVDKHSIQGDVSFDPNQNAWWNTYYYFDATSNYHPEIPWYVEDRTTNERIGPNPTSEQLITWFHTPSPANLYMLWRFEGGVTFAWDSNGASLGGGYTIQRRLSTEATWIDLGEVPATSPSFTDATLAGNATCKYRIVYFYGNKSSGPSNELAVPAYNPLGGSEENGGGGTGGSSGGNTGGTPPPGQDGPQDDPDNDGLTNEEEIEAGSDRTKTDTDEDGVDDGNDGWPQAKFLNTPRLPVWRYAVVELVNNHSAVPVALNSRGDIVYEMPPVATPENPSPKNDLYFLGAGKIQAQAEQIKNLNPGEPIREDLESRTILGLADDGRVVGQWERWVTTAQMYKTNFRWSPGSQSLVYTEDTCSAPLFTATAQISSHSYFTLQGITPSGTEYGTGYISAYRYDWPTRDAYIGSFMINRQIIPGYAASAFPVTDNWMQSGSQINDSSSSMSWSGSGGIINNSGAYLFTFGGLTASGRTPDVTPPTPGTYFKNSTGVPQWVSVSEPVALNDDLQILEPKSILARMTEKTASKQSWTAYSAPRINRAKPYGTVKWLDFNNRLEAIGSRTMTENGTTFTDLTVLINDHDYSIQDLVHPDWTIKGLVQINESGMILASAQKVGADATSIVILLPVEFATEDAQGKFLSQSVTWNSVSVPQIEASSVSAVIDGNTIDLAIAGKVTDATSDCTPTPAKQVSTLFVEDAVGHAQIGLVNTAQPDPDDPWRPYKYEANFSISRSIAITNPGNHTVTLQTSENAGGITGSQQVNIYARLNSLAQDAQLQLPANFMPQQADTITATLGAAPSPMETVTLTETGNATHVFKGQSRGADLTLTFAQVPVLSAAVDTIQATLAKSIDGQTVSSVALSFTETGNSTNAFPVVPPATPSYEMSIALGGDPHPGNFFPTIVRFPAGTASYLVDTGCKVSIMDHDWSVKLKTYQEEPYVYVVDANDKPVVFNPSLFAHTDIQTQKVDPEKGFELTIRSSDLLRELGKTHLPVVSGLLVYGGDADDVSTKLDAKLVGYEKKKIRSLPRGILGGLLQNSPAWIYVPKDNFNYKPYSTSDLQQMIETEILWRYVGTTETVAIFNSAAELNRDITYRVDICIVGRNGTLPRFGTSESANPDFWDGGKLHLGPKVGVSWRTALTDVFTPEHAALYEMACLQTAQCMHLLAANYAVGEVEFARLAGTRTDPIDITNFSWRRTAGGGEVKFPLAGGMIGNAKAVYDWFPGDWGVFDNVNIDSKNGLVDYENAIYLGGCFEQSADSFKANAQFVGNGGGMRSMSSWIDLVSRYDSSNQSDVVIWVDRKTLRQPQRQ